MAAPAADPKNLSFKKICELRPYMKGVNTIFIVLEKWSTTKTKDYHTIAHSLVADATGSIHLSLWDTQAEFLQTGDMIRLIGGYCTLYKNSLVLYSGRHGTLERVGDFSMVFSETPNMSLFHWVPDPVTKALVPVMPHGGQTGEGSGSSPPPFPKNSQQPQPESQ